MLHFWALEPLAPAGGAEARFVRAGDLGFFSLTRLAAARPPGRPPLVAVTQSKIPSTTSLAAKTKPATPPPASFSKNPPVPFPWEAKIGLGVLALFTAFMLLRARK